MFLVFTLSPKTLDSYQFCNLLYQDSYFNKSSRDIIHLYGNEHLISEVFEIGSLILKYYSRIFILQLIVDCAKLKQNSQPLADERKNNGSRYLFND